jgi:glutaredoxin-related protein
MPWVHGEGELLPNCDEKLDAANCFYRQKRLLEKVGILLNRKVYKQLKNHNMSVTMPARYVIGVSFGSDENALKRKELYVAAAKRLNGGNLSRLIISCCDKVLGINLPLPSIGRPKKIKK